MNLLFGRPHNRREKKKKLIEHRKYIRSNGMRIAARKIRTDAYQAFSKYMLCIPTPKLNFGAFSPMPQNLGETIRFKRPMPKEPL